MANARKAKAGENAGGADIPWIRNYKGAWGVVERAKMSCLLVLGNTHRVEPDWILTMLHSLGPLAAEI